MDHITSIAFDAIAITILVFGLYFPRHRNRDMIVAFLGINIGVLAVASVLSSVDVSLGVGIGLFGVLSIIRLRSDELNQRQVAYYFASLALGLLGGIAIDNIWMTASLMALLLLALWIGDSSWLLGSYRTQNVNIDRSFFSESDLITYVSPMVNGKVVRASILKTDTVNDTTLAQIVLNEAIQQSSQSTSQTPQFIQHSFSAREGRA